jgi:hypothetical protein
MTRIEKLEFINKEVQEMEINNDLGFFTHLLPDKLNLFLNLTYFETVQHDAFQNYLNHCRQILSKDTIDWCKKTELNETQWQKEYTLKVCRRHTKDFLWIIKKAFEYYIENNELLLKEEN